MRDDTDVTTWPFATVSEKKRIQREENMRASAMLQAAALPQSHDTAPAVHDIESAQMAADFAKLSVNGKRHAKAMIAGLLRLEAGAA